MQVAGVNYPNQFSLFGDDLWLAVCTFAVAEHLRIGEGESSVTKSHALASGNILRDGFALSLCKGTQHSKEHFGIHGAGVDVLFFKYDGDTELLQYPHILDAVYGVAGKAGN